MVEDISCHLVNILEATGYYSKVLGLAELLTKDEDTFPVVYEKNGQYQAINLDRYNGVSWFRIADVSLGEAEDDQLISCDDVVQIEYPFIIAGAIPRKSDSPFFIHKLVEDHLGVLVGGHPDLRTLINAQGLEIILNGYTTNIETEFEGIELSHKFSYFTLNITVQVNISQDCIVPCPA